LVGGISLRTLRLCAKPLRAKAQSRQRTRKEESSTFFFQAEAGIRDYKVTGVQTCALPISRCSSCSARGPSGRRSRRWRARSGSRSEERRVGNARNRCGRRRNVGKKRAKKRVLQPARKTRLD